MKKPFLFFLTFICLAGFAFGQRIERNVIATSGDYFIAKGVELSWTLGEVMDENYSNRSASLSQGFEQGWGFFKVLEEDFTDVDMIDTTVINNELWVKIYPNPTDRYINIDYSLAWEQGSFVEIIDLFGRSILTQNLTEIETKKLDVSALTAGIYILQIKNANTIKSFKINKIN